MGTVYLEIASHKYSFHPGILDSGRGKPRPNWQPSWRFTVYGSCFFISQISEIMGKYKKLRNNQDAKYYSYYSFTVSHLSYGNSLKLIAESVGYHTVEFCYSWSLKIEPLGFFTWVLFFQWFYLGKLNLDDSKMGWRWSNFTRRSAIWISMRCSLVRGSWGTNIWRSQN